MVAVLAGGTVDVLCHAAVRARNLGVMMVVCRDAALLQGAARQAGSVIQVSPTQASRTLAIHCSVAGCLSQSLLIMAQFDGVESS